MKLYTEEKKLRGRKILQFLRRNPENLDKEVVESSRVVKRNRLMRHFSCAWMKFRTSKIRNWKCFRRNQWRES